VIEKRRKRDGRREVGVLSEIEEERKERKERKERWET
jgi:hypothetical protein